MRWVIIPCDYNLTSRLNEYLEDGWEPFAVISTKLADTIWLRKQILSGEVSKRRRAKIKYDIRDELK